MWTIFPTQWIYDVCSTNFACITTQQPTTALVNFFTHISLPHLKPIHVFFCSIVYLHIHLVCGGFSHQFSTLVTSLKNSQFKAQLKVSAEKQCIPGGLPLSLRKKRATTAELYSSLLERFTVVSPWYKNCEPFSPTMTVSRHKA